MFSVDLMTMLWSSLAILILIVAVRILIWRNIVLGLKLLTNFLLLGLTLIPALILYLMKTPDLPWIIILDPPLFYDLGYALGIFDLATAIAGVLTFAFALFMILFMYLMPSPCPEDQLKQCLVEMYKRPSWLLAPALSYAGTMIYGLFLLNIQSALFKINPLYVILPFLLFLLSIYIILRFASRIIPLPKEEAIEKIPA